MAKVNKLYEGIQFIAIDKFRAVMIEKITMKLKLCPPCGSSFFT